MKKPISLKNEREVLSTAIKNLVDIKHRLSDLTDNKSEVAELYSSELLDVDMEISNICSSIGNMVGYTMYSGSLGRHPKEKIFKGHRSLAIGGQIR